MQKLLLNVSLTDYGPLSEIVSFTTSPEGYPGSPSQVVTVGQGASTVLVCWNASLAGGPFDHYTVTWVMSNGSTGIQNIDIADLETKECTLGATVSLLCML